MKVCHVSYHNPWAWHPAPALTPGCLLMLSLGNSRGRFRSLGSCHHHGRPGPVPSFQLCPLPVLATVSILGELSLSLKYFLNWGSPKKGGICLEITFRHNYNIAPSGLWCWADCLQSPSCSLSLCHCYMEEKRATPEAWEPVQLQVNGEGAVRALHPLEKMQDGAQFFKWSERWTRMAQPCHGSVRWERLSHWEVHFFN